MRKFCAGLFVASLALAGCDHQKSTNPGQAGAAPVAQNDSVLTGEPPVAPPAAQPAAYPRALPVSLPPATPSPVVNPPPVNVAETSPPPATTESTPAPASPPSTSPSATTPSDSPPEPKSSPDSLPPSLATAETSPEASGLAASSPSPVVSTALPPVLDEADGRKQVVVLETSLGRMVIELDDVSAPRTCGNFRKLVSQSFYDHTTFHRVIPHFMIQGGDPNSKADDRATYGQGDPGYTLPAEIKLKHVAGAVAMARQPDAVNPQRDSNGSQFFICVEDCPSLDDQYTVFGRVIQGMDTAVQISKQKRDPHDDPVTRLEMTAHLETKKEALEQSPANP